MTEHRVPVVCPTCETKGAGKYCSECGTVLPRGFCTSCGAPQPSPAAFCSGCGATLPAHSEARPRGHIAQVLFDRTFRPTLYFIAASVVVVAIAFAGGRQWRVSNDLAVTQGPVKVALSENAPDISGLSSRERAARLYDRILRYVEAGQRDSVKAFAWMALSSFQLLDSKEFDIDARYDYGRIATETGDLDIASAQADSILLLSPAHLLGLALSARVAMARGDTIRAIGHWKTFLAARDTELKQERVEYRAHSSDLESATNIAMRITRDR